MCARFGAVLAFGVFEKKSSVKRDCDRIGGVAAAVFVDATLATGADVVVAVAVAVLGNDVVVVVVGSTGADGATGSKSDRNAGSFLIANSGIGFCVCSLFESESLSLEEMKRSSSRRLT